MWYVFVDSRFMVNAKHCFSLTSQKRVLYVPAYNCTLRPGKRSSWFVDINRRWKTTFSQGFIKSVLGSLISTLHSFQHQLPMLPVLASLLKFNHTAPTINPPKSSSVALYSFPESNLNFQSYINGTRSLHLFPWFISSSLPLFPWYSIQLNSSLLSGHTLHFPISAPCLCLSLYWTCPG
jgi:hypothetical protein